MKVLILSDLEGVSSSGDYRLLIPAGPIYQQACQNLTEDINAVVRGLRAAGAAEIDLVDSHSTVWPTRTGPRNTVKDRIGPGIDRMMGGWDTLMLTRSQGDPLRSYDAQVIVGEHAMAGTPDGFASHTHSDNTALRINGQYIGEVAWHIWLLGYYGVPTIMVTGDAATIREARAFFPGIEGVAVKTATSRDHAECLPVSEARRLIQEAAARALSDLHRFAPCVPPSPIELDVIFTAPESARFSSYMPGASQVDDRTVSCTASDYLGAVWAHMSLVMLAALHVFGGDFEKLWKLSPEKARKQFNRDYEQRVDRWMQDPSPFGPPALGDGGE